MGDIVEHLRIRAQRQTATGITEPHEHIDWMAADEITRLRAENEKLRDALKPFSSLFLYPDDLGVEHAEDIRSDPDWDDDANDMQPENVFVFRGDIRRIRAAIQEGGTD